MAYYYGLPQQQQQPHHNHAPHGNHHGGRSRRGPRLGQAQNAHRPFRGVRSMKDLADTPMLAAYRARFESCKGFELDDDLEFCPGLLTEDDLSSVSSTASDRSSLASGSPSSSPLQQQVHPSVQVSPPFSLAPAFQPAPAAAAPPPAFSTGSLKLHQPSAVRSHKAIPIVNPSTGMRVASPPSSVSPGRMQQQTYARRW